MNLPFGFETLHPAGWLFLALKMYSLHDELSLNHMILLPSLDDLSGSLDAALHMEEVMKLSIHELQLEIWVYWLKVGFGKNRQLAFVY